MVPTPADVVARRRAERLALIGRARAFVTEIAARLDVRAAAVFGSVARGDFNDRSDIDVLVIADSLPDEPAARQLLAGSPTAGGVEAVIWTPAEWRARQACGDPIARDLEAHGVWLIPAVSHDPRP